MMYTREDRQALQTMIDNNTVTQADQHTPLQALKAIQTTIKDEEHYWHYRGEIMSDIRQEPQEQVHTLNMNYNIIQQLQIHRSTHYRDHEDNVITACHQISRSL